MEKRGGNGEERKREKERKKIDLVCQMMMPIPKSTCHNIRDLGVDGSVTCSIIFSQVNLRTDVGSVENPTLENIAQCPTTCGLRQEKT